jgi:predicted TPR repeat methyltransferase
MTPKQAYSKYIADDTLSELSTYLIGNMLGIDAHSYLDFGMGSGKHAMELHEIEKEVIGIDISMMNVVRAHSKYDLPIVICSDERILKYIKNCDVVFTCSVLDHIEDISAIIDDFKRIANKAIFLAETQDTPGEFYFAHDYESYGFEKVKLGDSDYEYRSEPPDGDGATYHIYKWVKGQKENGHANDDLCVG